MGAILVVGVGLQGGFWRVGEVVDINLYLEVRL